MSAALNRVDLTVPSGAGHLGVIPAQPFARGDVERLADHPLREKHAKLALRAERDRGIGGERNSFAASATEIVRVTSVLDDLNRVSRPSMKARERFCSSS